MPATEPVSLILDNWDYMMLSALSGEFEEHLSKAFALYAGMQRRELLATAQPQTSTFSRRMSSGIQCHIRCKVDVAACGALRSLGGSFQERAFDAVRHYLTNLATLNQPSAAGSGADSAQSERGLESSVTAPEPGSNARTPPEERKTEASVRRWQSGGKVA